MIDLPALKHTVILPQNHKDLQLVELKYSKHSKLLSIIRKASVEPTLGPLDDTGSLVPQCSCFQTPDFRSHVAYEKIQKKCVFLVLILEPKDCCY